MNYTKHALQLLDTLTETATAERIAEIMEIAEALATAERRFVGKGHVESAVYLADKKFLGEAHT